MKTLESLRLRQAVPWSGKSYAARPVDVGEISETIQRALSSAGLDTTSGPLSGVTRTIEKALAAAGLKKSRLSMTERSTVDRMKRPDLR